MRQRARSALIAVNKNLERFVNLSHNDLKQKKARNGAFEQKSKAL